MSKRRVSKTDVMVEIDYPSKRRISKTDVMVEIDYPSRRRVSNIAVMVEYVVVPPTWTPRILGPAVQ